MPCLLGCLALFFPRVVLAVLWLFTGFFNAYQTTIWPLLGFVFMPFTTLAYGWAMHEGGLSGLPLVVFVVAVLADLGMLGGGADQARRRGGFGGGR